MSAIAAPGPECGLVPMVAASLGVRRKLLRRFPFAIVFIELADSIRVLAVAHGARRPAYWRHRIR